MLFKSVLIICACLVAELTSIKVNDCGSQSMRLGHFATSNNKIKSNSILYLTSQFEILKEINTPVALDVEVKRKVWFAYVKVPCVKNLGSCTFNNGCTKLKELLAGKDCPPALIQSGLSCDCPMHAGVISLDKYPIKIPDLGGVLGSLAKGSYKVKAQLRNPQTGEVHLCAQVEADVE